MNAVEIACEFVAYLKSMQRELVQKGPFDPIYDVPHTTIRTGVIAGGTALNIILRQGEVTWEIRHHHMNTPDDLFTQAQDFGESLVPAMQAVAPDTGITHELKSVLPGFATAADSAIAQAHQPSEWVTLDQLAWCERFMHRLADCVCVA